MPVIPYFYIIVIIVFAGFLLHSDFRKGDSSVRLLILATATVISILFIVIASMLYDIANQTKQRNLFNSTYDTICTITSHGKIMVGVRGDSISYGNKKATIGFKYNGKNITTNDYFTECSNIRKK